MRQLTKEDKDLIFKALSNIKLPESFTYTNVKPEIIVKQLRQYILENEIPLKAYYPKWRWSKVVGYRNIGEYIVHYNVYKLSDKAAFLGMICHECIHMIGIGHGGNAVHWWNRKKKYASANFYIGFAVRDYLRNNIF